VHFGHIAEHTRILRQFGLLTGPLYPVFHAYDLTVLLRERGERFYARLFEDSEALLPISHLWAFRLKELGAPAHKIQVRRMGIDPDQLPFRRRIWPPNGPFEILSIARLVDKKGIEYAIRALQRFVSRSRLAARYHIVGEGPLRQKLQGLANDLGVGEQTVFHGWQSTDGVAWLLDSCHAFVLPSVTAANGDAEGLPVFLMEAMARGLPVVATDHSGIPELVCHEETGLLVPEADSSALTSALLEIFHHPARSGARAAAARARIEAEFDVRIQAQELAKLFDRRRSRAC
jgi:colanic acid/amylovoran biosynthesis glycosyltransferase